MKFDGFKLLDINRPTKKDAKYSALVLIGDKVKLVNFGSRQYQHYKDRTPLKLWSHLDHNDKKRRLAFHTRHANNNGIAAQLSKTYLW